MSQNKTMATELSKLINRFAFVTLYNCSGYKIVKRCIKFIFESMVNIQL